jgi:hypothetical protein
MFQRIDEIVATASTFVAFPCWIILTTPDNAVPANVIAFED